MLNGLWYCDASCFERAAREIFQHELAIPRIWHPATHRVPLGLILVSRHRLTAAQLREALTLQSAAGAGLIGYWLQKLRFVGEQDVTNALGLQWSCPVLSAARIHPDPAHQLVPLALLLDLKMLQVQFAKADNVLYLAFNGGINYAALNVIARMLGCRTEQCLIGDRSMDMALTRMLEQTRGLQAVDSDVVLDRLSSVEEMARIVCDYGFRFSAGDIRTAVCGSYLWCRIAGPGSCLNILFRAAPAKTSELTNPALPPESGLDISHYASGTGGHPGKSFRNAFPM